DNDVVLLAGGEIEPVAAVVGLVDDMAVLAQALGDVVGGLLVVFDEEDLHGWLVREGVIPGAARDLWAARCGKQSVGASICLQFPGKTTFHNYTNIQFSSHPVAMGGRPYSSCQSPDPQGGSFK